MMLSCASSAIGVGVGVYNGARLGIAVRVPVANVEPLLFPLMPRNMRKAKTHIQQKPSTAINTDGFLVGAASPSSALKISVFADAASRIWGGVGTQYAPIGTCPRCSY